MTFMLQAARVAAMCLITLPANAAATRFQIKPIAIAGATDVDAVALNNNGAIVGTYCGAGGCAGFMLRGTALTTLPPLLPNCACRLNPTTINAAGDIAGFAFNGLDENTFLWRNGTLVAAGEASLGFHDGTIGLNNQGQMFCNYFDRILTAYAGMPGAFAEIHVADGDFPLVTGQNNHGALAGQYLKTLVGQYLFVINNGITLSLSAPGAVNNYGGKINDAGQVAGSYRDSAKRWHGFVYFGGKYTIFNMPVTAANIDITGINRTGRVVGSFVATAKSLKRAFLYNGTTVSPFGAYPVTDAVNVAINDVGTLLVSDISNSQAHPGRSWKVLCHGDGC